MAVASVVRRRQRFQSGDCAFPSQNAAGSKRNVMGGPVTGPCQGTVVHGERLVGRVVSAKGVCGRGARERGTSGYGHHTPATAASRN